MTAADFIRVCQLRAEGKSIYAIANITGLHAFSIRWNLDRDKHNAQAFQKRREEGKPMTRCGVCKALGHNRRTCKANL